MPKKMPRTGQSPYSKYKKRPYKYSQLLYQWKDAIMRGDDKEASRLSVLHSRRFMPPKIIGKNYA